MLGGVGSTETWYHGECWYDLVTKECFVAKTGERFILMRERS